MIYLRIIIAAISSNLSDGNCSRRMMVIDTVTLGGCNQEENEGDNANEGHCVALIVVYLASEAPALGAHSSVLYDFSKILFARKGILLH